MYAKLGKKLKPMLMKWTNKTSKFFLTNKLINSCCLIDSSDRFELLVNVSKYLSLKPNPNQLCIFISNKIQRNNY